MKNLCVLLCIASLLGCAPSTYQLDKNVFLPQTVQELTRTLGHPEGTQIVPGNNQGQLLNYSNGTYQTENDQVRAFLKPAAGNESKLQHWLQLWQGQAYTKTDLELVHGVPKTVVYKNPAAKISVIYSVTSDEVQKVIYEK